MSIVIATLEENNCVSIFADRRIVVENKEKTYMNIGEIQKIDKLSDTILCGITGDAQWGISLAQELKKHQNRPASELIQIIENFDISFNDHSTFILGGKYDDGKLFYYGFTTENKKGGTNFATNALIATSPIEYLNNCGDFFILRSPAKSISSLHELNKLSSFDIARKFDQIFRNIDEQESIYLASPDLHKELIKWLQIPLENSNKLNSPILQTLYKYTIRKSFRCTPYGNFAGVSVGDVTEATTNLAINTLNYIHKKHTRLDMNYVCEIYNFLILKNPNLKRKLKYSLNTTIYKYDDSYRYYEYHLKNKNRQYYLVSVKSNNYLEKVIEVAKEKTAYDELIRTVENKKITKEQSENFINTLIKNQVLVSELEPTITGEEYFDFLLKRLRELNLTEDLQHLENVKRNLEDTTENLDKYLNINNIISEKFVKTSSKDLIQQDISLQYANNNINKEVLSDFVSSFEELVPLNQNRESKNLKDFKKKFIARYEDQSIPLLEVIDSESGIGYDTTGSSHTPFINGVFPTGRESIPTIQLNKKQKLANDIYEKSIISNKTSYTLNADELRGLKNVVSYDEIPVTFYAIGNVYTDNQSEYKFLNNGCGGTSGINLMTRFTHSNNVLSEKIKSIIKYENENQTENALFAEIVHLPESRVGNILQRTKLRNYEIPVLTNVTSNDDNTIRLSDIFISVKNNRICLFSKQLNKEIIPRLSTAHNYALGISIYKFLAEIQSQSSFEINWSWGYLKNKFFLPRVEYKNIILSRATWNISEQVSSKFKAAINSGKTHIFRKSHNIPDRVCLCQGDNELLLDFNSELSIQVLSGYLKKGDVILKEYLGDSFSLITNDENNHSYNNEIIIPIKNTSYKTNKTKIPVNTSVRRTFPFGSEWTYLKIYLGSKQADKIISQQIIPLIKNINNRITKWFFIRYRDPDNHIRLRLYHPGISAEQFSRILTEVQNTFNPILYNGSITNIQYDTYKRELERYGESTIDDIESIFHADSAAVMKFLNLIEGDEGERYRWLFAIKGVDYLLNDFDLNLEEKIKITSNIYDSFFKEFNGDKSLTIQLNNRFRSDRELLETFFMMEKYPIEEQEAIDLLDERSQAIKNILQNSSHSQSIKDKLPSILHMFLNRVFINNQRLHELITYHYINKLYLTVKHKYGK